DPARLARKHVTLAQVIASAGNAQLVSPLSYLQASTPGTGGFLDGPNQRLNVRHVLPFGSPRGLARVPLRGAPPGTRIGDAAHVVVGHQPLTGGARVGAHAGLVLAVEKSPGAGVAQVTREVDDALADLRPGLPG